MGLERIEPLLPPRPMHPLGCHDPRVADRHAVECARCDRDVLVEHGIGVKYIRAIPSRVVEMPGTKNPRIRYFDADGVEQHDEYDLVVLSVGLQVPERVSGPPLRSWVSI